MYELIQVGPRSYYVDCPAKVGIFTLSDTEAVLLDSGSDKDAAKKVKRILDEHGWTLRAIYNTHSHADHIGGNQYLQTQTGCRIYAPGIERAFTEFPVLEPALLYGAAPLKELCNKFLCAKESQVLPLTEESLPDGLSMISLPGHCYDMVGFRTCDDVLYLADSLSSAETLQKYGVGYIYDVGAYLQTLEQICEMEASVFVPSHAAQTADIRPLAELNLAKTREIIETIAAICKEPKNEDRILQELFRTYSLVMTLQQKALIGSTLKAYLAYLRSQNRIEYCFEDSLMLWKTVE